MIVWPEIPLFLPRAHPPGLPEIGEAGPSPKPRRHRDGLAEACANSLPSGASASRPRHRPRAALSDAAFAETRAGVLRQPGAGLARAGAHGRAVRRVRAPLRPAAAARDRPVPSSRGSQHPDPVEREEERAAHRAAGCRARTSIPTTRISRCRRARRRSIRASCPRPAATRCSRTSRRPTTTCPAAMKKRIAPLYGMHHYGNRNDVDETQPHRRLGADRRAEGEDAA